MMNKKILLILPLKLFPVSNGGQSRIFSLVKWLSKCGYQLEIITLSYDAKYFNLINPYIDKVWVLNSYHLNRQKAEKAFSSDRYPGLDDLAEFVSKQDQYVAVIAEFLDTSFALKKVPDGVLKILDTHDVHYFRKSEYNKFNKDIDYNYSLDEEKKAWLFADVLIGIQKKEQIFIQAHCPEKKVILAGHCLEPLERLYADENSKRILFVGNLGPPAIDGLNLFLENVWVDIIHQHPEYRLDVCGHVCEADLPEYDGVIYHGRVDHLNDFYKSASLVINPVIYGSGLNIKTVEAIGLGKCLVTTERGIIHLENHDEEFCVTAPLDNVMAEKIIYLIEDRKSLKKIEDEAFRYAETYFNSDYCFKEISAVLAQITKKKPTLHDESVVVNTKIDCYKHPISSIYKDKVVPVYMCFPKKLPPDSWKLHEKGLFLAKIGYNKEALSILESIQPYMKNYKNKYEIGIFHALLGFYDKALEIFLEVESLQPQRFDVKINISDILRYNKLYSQSLQKLDEVEKLKPDHSGLDDKRRLIAGIICFENASYEDALANFDKIDKESPIYIETRYQKGLTYEKLEDIDRAFECLNDINTNFTIRPDIKRNILEFFKKYPFLME